MTELVIPASRNGPDDSGNGGWSCGRFAQLVDGPAEVTLRRPPPLETPLDAVPAEGGVDVRAGDDVVAEVRALPAPRLERPPLTVGLVEARAAVERYAGFVGHAFPRCYVCGPENPDGLRIFAGSITGEVVAAPWQVRDRTASAEVWAALDCPGGWSAIVRSQVVAVLGRLAVTQLEDVEPGSELVAMGWTGPVNGRRHEAGSALLTPTGELVAVGWSTWVAIG